MRIRNKLLIVLVTMSVVVSSLLGFWAAHLLSQSVRESTIQRLDRELGLAGVSVPAGGDGAALAAFARTLGEQLELRVTLIAQDGSVLADSSLEAVGELENHGDRPEILAAGRGGRGDSFRRSETTGLEYYYRAQRVDRGRVGWVRIALPSSALERVDGRYLLWLVGSILGALALMGCLSWLVVGKLARPVERIAGYAEQVADGGYDIEIPQVGEDELGRLARSVNRMKESLVGRVHDLRADHGLFMSMTEGLAEGLLLVQSDQRVLVANPAFSRNFRLSGVPDDCSLSEVLNDSAALSLIAQCFEDGAYRRETVNGPAGTNRSFEMHVTPVDLPADRSGALILFFDITRQEALEHVRQRFIADVSHELRTPVTSIKGAVETLLDTAAVDDGRRRFLEIARRQADRMGELIADLTDLSRIETGAIDLDRRDLDLGSLVRDVMEAVRSRHSDREVSLECKVSASQLVFADRRRLEQVLINLIDNGVKYTPDGGAVSVAATREGGYDVVTVEDTGCGIPDADLEKVFNRFYRVDKARSRELGGTGLGLAIVKHLVKLHHGRIRVERGVNTGARFIFELPISEN